jgi:anti-sigma factor RsiW
MVTKKGGATCIEVARTLQQYLDGELDETTRARVAAHLAVCRRCGLDEQAYRDILAALVRRGDAIDREPIDRLRAFATSLTADGPPADTAAE